MERRDYKHVPDEKRYHFLKLVEFEELSIKKAATKTGINYENAKVILRNYRVQGIIKRRGKKGKK